MPRKVLIVDDEPEIVGTLETALTTWGYRVVTAMDGEEALAKARADRPDLVIADLNLPKLDGWGLCHRLKQDPAYQQVPFLFLSGLIQHDESSGGTAGDPYRDLGVAYLEKPISIERLAETLKTLLPAPTTPPAARPGARGGSR